MGLDLFHVMPSDQINEFDYFTIDEFESNPEYLYANSRFIATRDEVDYGFEVLVFSDLLSKELIVSTNNDLGEKISIIGEIGSLTDELNGVLFPDSVIDQDPLILKHTDFVLSKKTGKEIHYHSLNFKTKSIKIEVMYYSTIGYQRKGMNAEFYDDFENEKLYFDKSSVIKASSYLNPILDAELRNHFTANFIDNFVEGESIFQISW